MASAQLAASLPILGKSNNPLAAQMAISLPPAASASRLPADTLGPGGSSHLPGSARNGYAYGNCTYYVAIRRQVPTGWGNARSWLANAQRAGWAVGNLPQLGAIAWTPLGYYGHVAYVEQVAGNRVLISEMNYNGWNRVNQRWVSASEFKYIY